MFRLEPDSPHSSPKRQSTILEHEDEYTEDSFVLDEEDKPASVAKSSFKTGKSPLKSIAAKSPDHKISFQSNSKDQSPDRTGRSPSLLCSEKPITPGYKQSVQTSQEREPKMLPYGLTNEVSRQTSQSEKKFHD